MRSKEFYPFIRGKPNPLIYKMNGTQKIHPRKAETSEAFDITGNSLPRGDPSKKRIFDNKKDSWRGNSLFKKGKKAVIFIRGWPMMTGDDLFSSKPKGSENYSIAREIREWLAKTFFKKCRLDISDSGEIFRKGGIQGYLLT